MILYLYRKDNDVLISEKNEKKSGWKLINDMFVEHLNRFLIFYSTENVIATIMVEGEELYRTLEDVISKHANHAFLSRVDTESTSVPSGV